MFNTARSLKFSIPDASQDLEGGIPSAVKLSNAWSNVHLSRYWGPSLVSLHRFPSLQRRSRCLKCSLRVVTRRFGAPRIKEYGCAQRLSELLVRDVQSIVLCILAQSSSSDDWLGHSPTSTRTLHAERRVSDMVHEPRQSPVLLAMDFALVVLLDNTLDWTEIELLRHLRERNRHAPQQ